VKAFLLAAGHGTRLRPLTDGIPKCLVPIRGTPMLRIWLELCRRYGINKVLINLHAHADQVRAYLSRENCGPTVEVFEEPTLLGSAGTLLANRGWIDSDESFWVFYADVLTTANLGRMLDFHRSHGACATLGVYSVPDPSRCGVITADPLGVVRNFVEKPHHPTSNVVFSGILIGTPAMLGAIPAVPQADIARHLLPNLLGRMYAYPISEFLVDIGTMNNYRFAQESWPGLLGPNSDSGLTSC
jgi:mannose-1-phosphate guanylyltransferase